MDGVLMNDPPGQKMDGVRIMKGNRNDQRNRQLEINKRLKSRECLLSDGNINTDDFKKKKRTTIFCDDDSTPSDSVGKPVGILVSTSTAEDNKKFPSLSHGSVSLCGRRRTMEDTVTIAPGLLTSKNEVVFDFFAVYDGHGGSGVSHVCRDRLHRVLARGFEEEMDEIEVSWSEIDWKKKMEDCFLKMDDEVDEKGIEVQNIKSVGSTALVALVSTNKLVVANCGDSRGVLSRGGVAVPLSHDHKPDRPDEMERVEAAGGRVINWNGYRVLGVLATSRSIGDQYLKPYVISVPEVSITERTEKDEFVILASDGLWDVMSNEMACQVVRRCLNGQIGRTFANSTKGSDAAEAAAILAELAMARGSKDNISVVVIELSKSS